MLKHCYVFVDILALSFLVNAASIPQAGYQSPLDSGGSMLTVRRTSPVIFLPNLKRFST